MKMRSETESHEKIHHQTTTVSATPLYIDTKAIEKGLKNKKTGKIRNEQEHLFF